MNQSSDTDIRDLKESIEANTKAIGNIETTVIKQSYLLGYILFGIAGLILGAYLRMSK
jgi:hypothetical protein